YSRNEIQAQLVQRFNQAFHFGAVGSAAATVLPRWVAAGFGGTSKLSWQLILGMAGVSLALGFIGAITQYKSQTQKNYNKEMPVSDSIGTQLQKGVLAAH